MSKEIKYLNGYEIVDEKSRNDISEMKNKQTKAIIDVTVLPTENINEGSFYRLMTAQFIWNDYIQYKWTCECVDGLPSNPEPVSRDIVTIYAYYNMQDGITYGYVDDFVSTAAGGVPTGWYTLEQLAPAFELTWGGIITHIDEVVLDDAWRILLTKKLYMYDNGWKELPYAYESEPEFDVQWDGDMTDRMVLDMTALGYNNLYYVKVSDKVLMANELQGLTVEIFDGINNEFLSETIGASDILWIDDQMMDGSVVVTDIYGSNIFIVFVYDVDTLVTSLGIPTGIYTNGIYFMLSEDGYISKLVSSNKKVVKIDSKFLPDMNIDLDSLHTIATSGNYNDLYNKPSLKTVATTGSYTDLSNKPTIYTDVVRYNTTQNLSDTAKEKARENIDVCSRSEVDIMIISAIGSAIGGSY